MKAVSVVSLAALALPLAGCSSTSVQSDYDPAYNFSELSTYAWAVRTEAGKDHAILAAMGEQWKTPNGELYIIEKVWPTTRCRNHQR